MPWRALLQLCCQFCRLYRFQVQLSCAVWRARGYIVLADGELVSSPPPFFLNCPCICSFSAWVWVSFDTIFATTKKKVSGASRNKLIAFPMANAIPNRKFDSRKQMRFPTSNAFSFDQARTKNQQRDIRQSSAAISSFWRNSSPHLQKTQRRRTRPDAWPIVLPLALCVLGAQR